MRRKAARFCLPTRQDAQPQKLSPELETNLPHNLCRIRTFMNRSSNIRKASVRAEKIRVLIADDHTTFLAGLTSIIDMEQDMIVVAQATDGRQASDQCND